MLQEFVSEHFPVADKLLDVRDLRAYLTLVNLVTLTLGVRTAQFRQPVHERGKSFRGIDLNSIIVYGAIEIRGSPGRVVRVRVIHDFAACRHFNGSILAEDFHHFHQAQFNLGGEKCAVSPDGNLFIQFFQNLGDTCLAETYTVRDSLHRTTFVPHFTDHAVAVHKGRVFVFRHTTPEHVIDYVYVKLTFIHFTEKDTGKVDPATMLTVKTLK